MPFQVSCVCVSRLSSQRRMRNGLGAPNGENTHAAVYHSTLATKRHGLPSDCIECPAFLSILPCYCCMCRRFEQLVTPGCQHLFLPYADLLHCTDNSVDEVVYVQGHDVMIYNTRQRDSASVFQDLAFKPNSITSRFVPRMVLWLRPLT